MARLVFSCTVVKKRSNIFRKYFLTPVFISEVNVKISALYYLKWLRSARINGGSLITPKGLEFFPKINNQIVSFIREIIVPPYSQLIGSRKKD